MSWVEAARAARAGAGWLLRHWWIYEQHFNNPTLPADWFNGPERWRGYPHLETRYGNKEYQQYVPGQATIEYGRLLLTARRMTPVERKLWLGRVNDPNAGYVNGTDITRGAALAPMRAVDFVSGQISSYPAAPFAPGTIFSARLRIPVGKYLWAAVWAFDYVNSTEVDLFESSGRAFSDPLGNVSQGIHDFKSGPAGYHVGCAKISVPTAGEHTVRVDWSNPKRLDFYIDDKLNCSVAAGPRMTKPMSIILNLAVGSGGWPWIGVPDKNATGGRFLVDWVKVEKP